MKTLNSKYFAIILFLSFIVGFSILFLLFNNRVSANQEFPSCESMQENGDYAHYGEGWHQIYDGGLLWGSDDVYSLGYGNYLQCFCPETGLGIQTNWYKNEEGSVNGLQWNLGDYQYNAENESYTCNEPEPTPEVTESPTATPEATLTATPVFSGKGDGLSDNRSDGLSSCPECTKAPVIPAGPPATGR